MNDLIIPHTFVVDINLQRLIPYFMCIIIIIIEVFNPPFTDRKFLSTR